MSTSTPRFCLVTRQTDDNGNRYYLRLDELNWATVQAAHDWARYVGDADYQVLQSDHPRILPPTVTQGSRL